MNYRTIKAKIKGFFAKNPTWNIDKQHTIVPAFEWGGVQYYQFKNINDIMCGRAFAVLDFYQELSMRTTREYLQAYTTAVENVLTQKNINIGKIWHLNTQLQERLDMIIDTDIVLKIASVVYFTEEETPYDYDYKFGQEKIAKWKAGDINSFFLQTPVKDLIPALNLSEADLGTYMKVGATIKAEHLKVISTMLSETDKKKDFYNLIDWRSITDKP